jgi:cytochrome P450
MYPEVQTRAREEVDRVIGTNRLPILADRDKLPYINAIVKEVVRWNVVAPTGI